VVTDTTHTPRQARFRAGFSGRSLAGVLILAAAVALAAVLVAGGVPHHSKALAHGLGLSGNAGSNPASHRAGEAPPPRLPASVAGAVRARGSSGRTNIVEVADPQESSSFPVPASVHHKAAAAPARAGEGIVAAGAPSDAEVRAELAKMQAVERAAKQAQRPQLTPVQGGNSIGGNGAIQIPEGVPEVVQRVVAGANAIADFPYVFGGGHASFVDSAYDCSGSVSYALAAGGLLGAPETSGELESWGAAGPGRYITVLAAAGHTYMYVDGILYDTAGRSGPYASRWQVGAVDNSGYVARHWPGL
jgi:cell wall-associated NlpC family hydrolase